MRVPVLGKFYFFDPNWSPTREAGLLHGARRREVDERQPLHGVLSEPDCSFEFQASQNAISASS
jgi:hypothetical protein